MKDHEPQIEAEQEFAVRAFRPGDAQGVADLFTKVYGNAYPVKLVYNPGQLVDAFNASETIPMVACTGKGEVVGYEAFYRSAPNPRLYELGQGLILPSYRNLGIAGRFHAYAYNVMASEMEMDVIFAEPVCNHVFMQKSLTPFRSIVTALEVDLMPAEAYAKEQSASGRVSVLSMFTTCRSRPHVIYLPPRHADALTYIYGGFDDSRTLMPAPEKATAEPPSSIIEVQIFDVAGVARMAVREAGEDFSAAFAGEEERALGRGVTILQVWIKLSWPWVGVIAEYLRGRGYFLGGALPGWFGEDGLLMQKVMGTPNWEGIRLYTDRAHKVMELVRTDWRSLRDEG